MKSITFGEIIFTSSQYLIVIVCGFLIVIGLKYALNYLRPMITNETYARKIEASLRKQEYLIEKKKEYSLQIENIEMWKQKTIKKLEATKQIARLKGKGK